MTGSCEADAAWWRLIGEPASSSPNGRRPSGSSSSTSHDSAAYTTTLPQRAAHSTSMAGARTALASTIPAAAGT